MNWAAFHLIIALFTVFFAVGGLKSNGRSQHVYGAMLLLASWIASWLARNLTGKIDPYVSYAIIDMAVITGYWLIMMTRRAAWAAVCVILFGAMLMLHLAYFVQGEAYQTSYLRMLGILLFCCAATIVSAITAGRTGAGEVIDRWFYSHLWRSTWSGLLFPRYKTTEG